MSAYNFTSMTPQGKSEAFGTSTDEARLREAFERDGFLVVENFYTDEECDELRTRMAVLVDGFDLGTEA